MGVSLKPSDATQGGGLLDDEDVKITGSKFVMFDYNGKATPVPALLWLLDRMDGTEPIAQYWSMGKGIDWMPSDNGKELVPIGKATQLVEDSNGMLLITSLINAGVPESKVEDDVSIFNGMECHVNRVAAPDRKGLVNKKENQTILVVTKIHKAPWDKGVAKGKGSNKTATKSKGKENAKATANDTGDIESIATEFILGLLTNDDAMSKYPDGIPKAKLAPEAFAAFQANDPNRSAIVRKVFEDSFLNSGPWSYTGGKIAIG